MSAEQKLRKLIREELKSSSLKEDVPPQQSTPVQVGKYTVTVGLKSGNVNIYNKDMTQKLATLSLLELELMAKMSRRKNTDNR